MHDLGSVRGDSAPPGSEPLPEASRHRHRLDHAAAVPGRRGDQAGDGRGSIRWGIEMQKPYLVAQPRLRLRKPDRYRRRSAVGRIKRRNDMDDPHRVPS